MKRIVKSNDSQKKNVEDESFSVGFERKLDSLQKSLDIIAQTPKECLCGNKKKGK